MQLQRNRSDCEWARKSISNSAAVISLLCWCPTLRKQVGSRFDVVTLEYIPHSNSLLIKIYSIFNTGKALESGKCKVVFNFECISFLNDKIKEFKRMGNLTVGVRILSTHNYQLR